LWDYQSQGKWRFICTRDPNLPKGHKDRWREHAFEDWSMQVLEHFVRRHSHLDLYFCPHGFTHPIRKKEYAVPPLMLYADLDKVLPSDCMLPPNISVESSPGRYQAYWLLTEQLDRDDWESLNQAWTYANGADKGGWDLTQVLRIPSTVNHKYDDLPPVRILASADGETYDAADIRKMIPAKNGHAKNDDGAAARAWRELDIPSGLRHALLTTTVPDDRSKEQYRIGMHLLELGATRDELKALLAGCPWQKFTDDQLDDDIDRMIEKKGVDESAFTFQQYATTAIPRLEFVYGRYYARGILSSTSAAGGVGKTRLVVAEAVAMVTGIPLLHVKPRGLLRVGYIGEEPSDSFHRQVQAVQKHFGITDAQIGGRLVYRSMRDIRPLIAVQNRDGTQIMRPMVNAIVQAICNEHLNVLIVDPVIKSHNVNENDNVAIEKVVSKWADISYKTYAAIMLTHHTRKGNGHEKTSEDSRGASSFINECRINRVVQKGNEVGEFRVDQGKVNDIKESRDTEYYYMTEVTIANGDDVGVVTPQAHHVIVRKGGRVIDERNKPKANGPSRPSDARAWAAIVKLGGRTTTVDWEAEADMPRATLYDAAQRLVKTGRVAKDGDTYTIMQ
jgi:hypothetical protein